MPTVKVNDINVYYEIAGEGEPLILIGGLSADLTTEKKIIDGIAKKYHVVAFDNRGSGRTDKPDAPYSIEMMAEDTVGLMEALGMRQAHVLGISMGGRIAMALALRHPAMVKSLVLTSTYARKRDDFKLPLRIRLIKLIVERLKKYPQPRYAFDRHLVASRGYDCRDRLGDIRVPTLIMHGENDDIAPLPLGIEVHEGIKGSRMITFKGGHTFFMGKPEQFCNTVLEFLAGVR